MTGPGLGRGLGCATLAGLVLSGCQPIDSFLPGRDPQAARGVTLAERYGCVTCHEIPGTTAAGYVGPALGDVRRRAYLAGGLPNTPAAMAHWIRYPERARPGTLMPNLQVTEADARELVAFLYALR